MNSQLAKNIRRYVKIKIKEEHLPDSEEKRLYKVFKNTYETANPEERMKYDQNMKDKFQELDEAAKAPAT